MIMMVVQAVLTVLNLVGSALNSNKVRFGFVIWLVCNFGWLAIDIQAGSWPRCIQDIIQAVLCVYGLIQWGRK